MNNQVLSASCWCWWNHHKKASNVVWNFGISSCLSCGTTILAPITFIISIT